MSRTDQVWIKFTPTANEGPEPQTIGNPYNIIVTPGEPILMNKKWAEALMEAKPGFEIIDPPAGEAKKKKAEGTNK